MASQNQTNTDTTNEEQQRDQYDTLLRAAEEGLILTLNNSVDQPAGTDEMVVEYSNDKRTEVALRGWNGNHFQIHREDRGLIYSEITEDGLSYEDDVISIEVIGIE